jgi:polar amino acid transport system ATP-binding protein
METKQPLIHVRDLSKYYHQEPILKAISVDIEEGDLVSIIGPSGCGKSTFLRCLNGMEILDSGLIQIDGVTLSRKTPTTPLGYNFNKKAHELRQHIGMVFQSFNLFPHKTLLQNVMLALMIVQHKTKEEAEDISLKFLEKVGLKLFAHRYPAYLSGGQQQRGAIARALALSPKVMLYDEPTSAIDPARVDEVLEVMRDLDKEGMTQIIVTHEMRFAKDASDYIIYMEQGEFIEISDEDEIFIAPKDERTRQFLKNFM